jgi:hypothetical protein
MRIGKTVDGRHLWVLVVNGTSGKVGDWSFCLFRIFLPVSRGCRFLWSWSLLTGQKQSAAAAPVRFGRIVVWVCQCGGGKQFFAVDWIAARVKKISSPVKCRPHQNN